MAIWLTADLHLGHEKVALARGFSSTEEHDEHVLSGIHKRVREGDELFVLGDAFFGPDKFELGHRLGRLVDRLHLVTGNHDRAFPGLRGAHNHHRRGGLCWFDTVLSAATLRHSGIQLLLSHFPYDGDHTAEDREVQWRLRDLGQPIVHGHTHSDRVVSFSKRGSLQLCVSLEAWDMKPVPLGELASLALAVGL